MNDFLDCCRTVKAERDEAGERIAMLETHIEKTLAERDERLAADLAIASGMRFAMKERDDARLEADRLRAEIARIAKERDDATAEIRRLMTPSSLTWRLAQSGRLNAERLADAAPPAWPGRAEVFEGLEKIEEIVSGTLRDEPGTAKCDQCDPWQRLARIAVLTGRLIAVTR